jgi:hypothetical protein
MQIHTQRLLAALRVLRSVDPEMPLFYAGVFLEVGIRSPNPYMLSEVPKTFGVSRATASRAHVYLSNYFISTGLRKKPGHGLIRSEPSPGNRRCLELTLTPKGKRIYEDVVRSLEID